MAKNLVNRAIDLNKGNSDYHFLAAEINAEKREFGDAVDDYLAAILLDERQPDYHFSLANAYFERDQIKEAISHYLITLSLDPLDHECHNNLANCYDKFGQIEKSQGHYQRAIQLMPGGVEYQLNFADFLATRNRQYQAVEVLRHILANFPGQDTALFKLAVCYQELGQFDLARKYHSGALSVNPRLAISAFHLSSISKGENQKISIEAGLERLATESDPVQRCYWHFTLANHHQENAEYGLAFRHFKSGNAIKAEQFKFDRKIHGDYIQQLMEFFTAEFFTRTADSGSMDAPIFIVGMPRSGSSLVEQILSSHPKITGVGEHNAMRDLVKRLPQSMGANEPYPKLLASLVGVDYAALASKYLNDVGASYPVSNKRICDKMLGNFLRLGFIAKLFPGAKIVHTVRNPLDCCLSCFTQLFQNGMNFSYDLDDLGFAYRQYHRLLEHWQKVLPLTIHPISYEQLVTNPKTTIKDLVAFCGLGWSEEFLNFQKNNRMVKTASFWQVRQPIYNSSIERWRHYASQLQPLVNSLGPLVP